MSTSVWRWCVLGCLLCLSCGDSHPRNKPDAGGGGASKSVSDAGPADPSDEALLVDLNGKQLTTVCAEAEAEVARDEKARTNFCTQASRLRFSVPDGSVSDVLETESPEARCLAKVQRCLDNFGVSLCTNTLDPACTTSVGDLRHCAAWYVEHFSQPMPSCAVPLSASDDPSWLTVDASCERVRACFVRL